MELVAQGMTKRCADKVFTQAGFAPGQGRDEVGVIELHDCFAPTEVGLMTSRHHLAMTILLRTALLILCIGALCTRSGSQDCGRRR